MANIKSAEKRIEVIDKLTLRNKSYKSKIATMVKKYKLAVDNKEENTDKLLSEVFSLVDSAVSKGILARNTADRKKARLSVYGK